MKLSNANKKRDSLTVEEYKALKYKEIDDKTSKLIGEGFTYGGKKFSLSPIAQTNITNTFISKDALTYPVRWNTKDDAEAIDIADATEMTGFYQTALVDVKTKQDTGTALKDSVRVATTKAEVDAVIDNR